MTTIANECRKAALDGIAALITKIRFDSAADAELATLPVAWGAATTASPSTALGTCTADSSVTAGTIAKFEMRTSGGSNRITGSVGVGTGDIQISDTVIPGTATSVSCPGGITISLQIS